MSLYRRIGTTSFLYRDSRTEAGRALEQEAVLRCIADAGALKIDILLFQEEYTFWQSDVEDAPERRRFAPTQWPRPSAPAGARRPADLAIGLDDAYVTRVREAASTAGVNVILPVVERDGERLYNSLLPVSAQGALLRPYRKMFPVPAGELSAGIMPGTGNAAQLIAGVPVSFAICSCCVPAISSLPRQAAFPLLASYQHGDEGARQYSSGTG